VSPAGQVPFPEGLDGLELERLRQELARHKKIGEAAYALHTSLDLDDLLGLILKAAREGVDADRGTVYLVSSDGKELWSRVLSGNDKLTIRLPVGRGIAGTVAADGATVRLDDVYTDPRFDRSWDAKTGYRTRTMLAAPIRNREGKVVGVFQLINKREGPFDAEDEGFLEALSVHAALAVENATLHHEALERERQTKEIALAQEIQRKIQPERLTREVGSVRAAGMNELCEDASGDYYDLIDLPDGRLAFGVGDVSGHGLGSALVMAQARAWLRAFAKSSAAPHELLALLNDSLAPDLERGKFMTFFLGAVDPATGVVAWGSAGHPAAIVLRAKTGAFEDLPAGGVMLGVFAGFTYPAGDPVTLEPGDTLLVYTDGATEAADAEHADAKDDAHMFGETRLKEILRTAAPRGPEAVLDAVRAALHAFTGSDHLKDDLTLLVLQRT
jgi:sigma-B regulation protein RsbU (phosphoserine phosphatase)